MVGLFIAYACFVVIGLPKVVTDLLSTSDWSMASMALPVTFAAFGFQGTVPTLASWMHYDRKRLRKSILIGTSITLVVYILWQWLFHGIVPRDGPHGLIETLNEGRDAVYPLQYFTNNPWIWGLGRAFAFFALVTSFLGVGIGLVDFLADGLKKDKAKPGNMALLLFIAFGLPLVLALAFPHIFIAALGLAGGFGCAILLGMLPIIMVWKAKFQQGINLGADSALFTQPVFLGLLAFVSIEIVIECLNLINKL
jgi:tyrosine-specific transport protein